MDRDGLRRLQETFPGGKAPEIQLRRVTGAGDVWFAEIVIHYTDGTVYHGVNIGSSSATARSGARPATTPSRSRSRRGVPSWSRPVIEEPVAG